MAQRPKPAPPKMIALRVTDDQMRVIDAAAQQLGMQLATYARSVVLAAARKAVA